MGRTVDTVLALRILHMLVTPFDETDAFRLGIIDKHGKILKKTAELNSNEELDAYNLLNRLVFRLKRIIEKVPIENKKLLSYAAAYSLVREGVEANSEPIDLETRFLELQEENLLNEVAIVKNYLAGNYIMSFKTFVEEIGNTTANVAGIKAGDEPPGKTATLKKLIRRKELMK